MYIVGSGGNQTVESGTAWFPRMVNATHLINIKRILILIFFPLCLFTAVAVSVQQANLKPHYGIYQHSIEKVKTVRSAKCKCTVQASLENETVNLTRQNFQLKITSKIPLANGKSLWRTCKIIGNPVKNGNQLEIKKQGM